jgi:hypothetical protein
LCRRSAREPKLREPGFHAEIEKGVQSMNAIIYLVGLVVIVLAIISFVS